ncbi:amidohydrolase [Kineobactrum salinum]|uniref:Amidohydrolase family protein n=1 Tax=Kineobactrum salinum TaxID=2708301 RepID=A0A6C0U4K1_9GAMM|nr:amidohydrolase family protein [Kineobactrum salinum]QIB66773.1 amidohydrolase family protein [Kineobactrum salinum]
MDSRGQWDSGFFERFDIPSPRRFLDEVSGDKAIVLSDDSHHNGWANSRALELAGVTADTPDPSGGSYGREPGSDKPNGLLFEAAKYDVFALLPEWTPDQLKAGAFEAVRVANRYGVVGIKDANATTEVLAAYDAVVRAGGASTYIAAAIATPRGRDGAALDYEQLDAARDRYHSDELDVRYVKLYLDGVPTASRTAAMLEDYLPATAGGATHNGKIHISPEQLFTDILELDRRGYTVKIHTAGDRAVRVALDAIARVREANGDSGLRHELAHAGYIAPQDLPRFKKLDVVADLSPYLWYPSGIMESIVGALGDRGERYWPVRDLLDAEAPVLAGSDWPAGVQTMNPWEGIEAIVTRRHPQDSYPGTLWQSQAITLAEALLIFTQSGARALRLEGQTGMIRGGQSADFVVLEESLFDIPVDAISDTEVMQTVFQGRVVYEQ